MPSSALHHVHILHRRETAHHVHGAQYEVLIEVQMGDEHSEHVGSHRSKSPLTESNDLAVIHQGAEPG